MRSPGNVSYYFIFWNRQDVEIIFDLHFEEGAFCNFNVWWECFFFQAIKYNFNEKYKVFSSQASVYYNMVGTTNWYDNWLVFTTSGHEGVLPVLRQPGRRHRAGHLRRLLLRHTDVSDSWQLCQDQDKKVVLVLYSVHLYTLWASLRFSEGVLEWRHGCDGAIGGNYCTGQEDNCRTGLVEGREGGAVCCCTGDLWAVRGSPPLSWQYLQVQHWSFHHGISNCSGGCILHFKDVLETTRYPTF